MNAFEFSGIKFNIGYIGVSTNTNKEIPMELDFFNFGFEWNTGIGETQLGIEISPFKLWLFKDDDYSIRGESTRCSVLNLGIYWNLFTGNISDDYAVSFAPFTKMNYIHIAESTVFKWNEYVYSAGIRVVLTYGNVYNLFCSELGYRNVNSAHCFYFSLNMDMGVLFLVWLTSKKD